MHRNEVEQHDWCAIFRSGAHLANIPTSPMFQKAVLKTQRAWIRDAFIGRGRLRVIISWPQGCAKRKHAVHVNLRCSIVGGTAICRAAFVLVLHVCILSRILRKQKLIWTQ